MICGFGEAISALPSKFILVVAWKILQAQAPAAGGVRR